MSDAQRPADGSPSTSVSISVRQAAAAYLETIQVPTTHRVYAQTIGNAAGVLGPDRALTDVEDHEVGVALQELWGSAAASTWNTRRAAVASWLNWCRRAGYTGPAVPPNVQRRTAPAPTASTRVHAREEIDDLTSSSNIPIRETTLWRMLYDTAAAATDILALNVEDLDLASRSARLRARGTHRGGRSDTRQEVPLAPRRVFWGPATERLLAHHLQDRTVGPIFLSTRPPREDRRLAEDDLDPMTGYARLTYSSAVKNLDRYTASDGPGTGWKLHELRVSARLHTRLDQAVDAVGEVWRQIDDLDPALARPAAEDDLAELAAEARDLERSGRPLAVAGGLVAEAAATIERVIETARAATLSPRATRQAHQDLAQTMALSEAASNEVRAAAARARTASGARR